MADPRDVLAQRVSAALGAAFGPEYADADPVIRPSSFADYQSNAALPLARQLGRPPRDIAADIVRHLDLAGVAEPPEVSGPGFLNLRLLPGWIVEAGGHRVARGAHLGDWGTPFGMLIEHALDIGEEATRKQLVTGEFTAFYQAARAEFDREPDFADRARRRVALLQGGEPESPRLCQVLVRAALANLMAIYPPHG